MTTSQTSKVIQQLRAAVLLQDGAGLTDGQLLGCFVERRDEAAFAALVKRHGPMIWGVCRRLLSHHDAEDAFQAAFLVLSRKAATVLPREMVANWLHGVARQTALQIRRIAVRRRARERQVSEMPEPASAEQDLWRDLQPLLDEALRRLPDKYRAVIVLCDLEGKTRKEVARQLGVPEGTVAGWLARARAMLAKRLARHGFAVSGAALAAALSQSAASAVVPTSVVCSTIKAASLFAVGQAVASGVISVQVAAVAEGASETMLLKKVTVATLGALVLAAFGLALGGLGYQTWAKEKAYRTTPAKKEDKAAGASSTSKTDADKLQGIWTGSVVEVGGRPVVVTDRKEDQLAVKAQVLVKGRQLTLRGPTLGTVLAFGSPVDNRFEFSLDDKKTPKRLDLVTLKGPDDLAPLSYLGYYSIDGDNLKICVNLANKKRPAEFKTQAGTSQVLIELKRDAMAKWEELPKPEAIPQLKR